VKKLFFVLFLLCTLPAIAQKKVMSADETVCKTTVIDFYKWYKANSRKIDAFVLYKGKKKNNMPPYIIDWKAVDRYFAFVRKSVPYLGEAFISNEKKFFADTQKDFDIYPDDEVPPGFDYDRFTDSQEDAKYTLSQVILNRKSQWDVKLKGNTAVVYITVPGGIEQQKAKVELTKEKDIWKISHCLQYDK
jgi:hypothetical protein